MMMYLIVYIDKNSKEKYPVYAFRDKMAEFDPVTGNLMNRISGSEINTMFICEQASKKYSVNGIDKYASAPVAHNEKLFLPIRFIAGELGYSVLWEDGVISIESNKGIIKIYPNGEYSVKDSVLKLSEQQITIEGITYVSLNDICSIFGMQSSWDTKTQKIYVLN